MSSIEGVQRAPAGDGRIGLDVLRDERNAARGEARKLAEDRDEWKAIAERNEGERRAEVEHLRAELAGRDSEIASLRDQLRLWGEQDATITRLARLADDERQRADRAESELARVRFAMVDRRRARPDDGSDERTDPTDADLAEIRAEIARLRSDVDTVLARFRFGCQWFALRDAHDQIAALRAQSGCADRPIGAEGDQ